MYKPDDYDYTLPNSSIAQFPSSNRTNSRLLVIDREAGTQEDKHFFDLPDYLQAGDVLVLNDSKVIHARLTARKHSTAAKIELFLLKDLGYNRWEVLVRPLKRLSIGDEVIIEDGVLTALLLEKTADGSAIVEFDYSGAFEDLLDKLGAMPLPPYIKRLPQDIDTSRYQTVYSHSPGSVAAPTAGLHFSEELLQTLKNKGINLAYVTLHIGLGTFQPIKTADIRDHKMHTESYHIKEETASLINSAKANGRRIVCVGTTAVRTIESAAGLSEHDGSLHQVRAGSGETDIFIYEGYNFKMVDKLITNFHLPKSTLLMLVSAFYDREKILAAYKRAISQGYRVFSYGDAMLIL